jgi:hypothetical protein
MAAGNGARYLADNEGGHVEIGVLLGVADQRAGDLFGSHKAHIGDKVAVDGVGKVDVEDDAGEVGAVVEEEVEVTDIAPVVEDGHESLVLFRRAVDLEAVDCPVERGAYELRPLPFGGSALPIVRRQIEQVLFAVGVAQDCSLFPVHRQGNVARRIDRIKIRDQGDGNPVIPVNLVVAADDDAKLAVVAGAEHDVRIGADVIEIYGGVAGGVHRTKFAVGLFHQERDRGVDVRCCHSQKAEEQRCAPKEASSYEVTTLYC